VKSLDELVRRVPVVVEADVQGIFPSTPQDGGGLQTDVLFRVVRVLKGDETLKQFVVSQIGGSVPGHTHLLAGVDPMEVGERYILFLSPAAGRQSTLPARDVPRFISSPASTFSVKDGTIQITKELQEIAKEYQGLTSDQFAAEVRFMVAAPSR